MNMIQQEPMMHEQPDLRPLHAKFGRVLAAVEPITKDQTADTGSYTYAYTNVNSILHMLKPILAGEGLALSQPIMVNDDKMIIQTVLIDVETGDSIGFPGPGFPIKGDPQAAGSAITYMRRYALVSLFSLEQSDDDGATAHRADTTPQNRTQAETDTRALIAAMTDKDERRQLIADFREVFGASLIDLPESRHGDALGWVKSQLVQTPEEG